MTSSTAIPMNPFVTRPPNVEVDFTEEFEGLFEPHRYKVRWGGRGARKSWEIARALLIFAHAGWERILCARELQNSIKDSVHRLLQDQMGLIGLSAWFEVTQTSIRHKVTGAEFIFKGLKHNANEIKSTEGVTKCWVEEAQVVSKESWEMLIPTIRREKSEIWVSFNPLEETDDTYQRFVINPPPDCDILKVNYDSNPDLTQVLELERLYMLKEDPDAYDHVWLGHTRKIGSSVVFKNKYVIEIFNTPTDPPPTFCHGLDFGGLGSAPMCLTRNYITGEPPDEHLWVDREVYAYGVSLDQYPEYMTGFDSHGKPSELSAGIDTARQWPIIADSAEPKSVDYLAKQGFNIAGADKWAGSVEDGIQHLKAFKMIHIHATNCPYSAREARLYSWKVDKNTGMVLPVLVDANNHFWDASRYSHNNFIQNRGGLKAWERLS
jgi:phage terminase large subunit